MIRTTIVGILLLVSVSAVWAETKEEEAQRYLETMVQSIIDDNDPMRNRMFIKLRYIGTPSIDPMLGVLGHEDPAVRRYVAFTLGFLDDPSVVEPLMNLFRNDATELVKTAAAEALGRLECAEAIDMLVSALGDPSSKIRQSAAYSLGLIGDPKATPALEKAKSDDEDELVRWFAGEAIGFIDRAVARKNRS